MLDMMLSPEETEDMDINCICDSSFHSFRCGCFWFYFIPTATSLLNFFFDDLDVATSGSVGSSSTAVSMNPHAPAETIAALLDVNMEVAFRLDKQGKILLDYARDYNVGGLVGMINGLCNHRHAVA